MCIQMPKKLKHPINIKLTDLQYEYFSFICTTQRKKMSDVIRTFIDGYIQKHMDIIKEDNAHHQILVQKEDGTLEWTRVRTDEKDKEYIHIGNAVYKRR